MVHLMPIWEPIGNRFMVDWSPLGVGLGVGLGVNLIFVGSILRSDSDSGLRPLRDQISRSLGLILALLFDPMLVPCWPPFEAPGG